MTTIYDLPDPGKNALKQSQALSDYIRHEIDKKGGFISFAEFMKQALYHPKWGYYNSDTFHIGKTGDFITAPEISPLFAQCFARQALQIFNQLGKGYILELGAGTGQFAKDLLLELNKLNSLPEHYYIYEISPALRQKQQSLLQTACPTFFQRIEWQDTLPTHLTGIVIANEVLDALPVHCFHLSEHEVKERCVSWEKNTFVWQLHAPTTAELAQKVAAIREHYALSVPYESEINLELPQLIQKLARALDQGVILFADYGYGQAEYYHPKRDQGSLSCFYQHRRHDNPLILPGLQDITAHVDFTCVAETAVENECDLAGYTTQAAFLLSCGLMELATEKEKNFNPPGTHAIDEFNLHQEIKRLILPSEMGERIKVMALSKNITLPLLGFGLQDRRRDL